MSYILALMSILASVLFASSVTFGEDIVNKAAPAMGPADKPIGTIRPVFSQLVAFTYPAGFTPALEQAKGNFYIQEGVRVGETVEKWSEMLTVTGTKGLSSNEKVTPKLFAAAMAGGFKKACPKTFNVAGLGEVKVDGYDAFGILVGCGIAKPSGPPFSESALIMIIKGEKDYYSIQWAERSIAFDTPVKFDRAKWAERWKQLSPIKLCGIVTGEPAPYPSCINRK